MSEISLQQSVWWICQYVRQNWAGYQLGALCSVARESLQHRKNSIQRTSRNSQTWMTKTNLAMNVSETGVYIPGSLVMRSSISPIHTVYSVQESCTDTLPNCRSESHRGREGGQFHCSSTWKSVCHPVRPTGSSLHFCIKNSVCPWQQRQAAPAVEWR